MNQGLAKSSLIPSEEPRPGRKKVHWAEEELDLPLSSWNQTRDAKSQFIGEDPDAGKIKGRRRGRQRMRWLDGITDSMDII